MQFIIDAQLPPAIGQLLRSAGHSCDHVMELGLANASDRMIWEIAVKTGAIILTKDEDFAKRRVHAKNGPKIVWIRIRNTRKQALLDWFAKTLPDVIDLLESGETLVEIA